MFPVVTAVLCILSVVGIGTGRLREALPPAEGLRQVDTEEDFILEGSKHEIDWLAPDSDAFAEARRTDKPIFMVIGDVCSPNARLADRDAFRDRDVVDRLRQQFVCIRIDVSQMPAWRSAYLPISRAKQGFDPLFQVWVLNPAGELLTWGMANWPQIRADRYWMLSVVRGAQDALRKERSDRPNPEPPNFRQKGERDALMTVSGESLDVRGQVAWVQNSLSPGGGVMRNGFQAVEPGLFRLLHLQNGPEAVAPPLDGLLSSRMVDWIDGGFFRTSVGDWKTVYFDQSAAINAEMSAVMAAMGARTGDRWYSGIAARTFDALYNSFRLGPYIRSYRKGDEDGMGRSARASFSPRELRLLFDERDREWLRDNFGLKVESNPQMVVSIRIRQGDEAWLRRAESMLARMRKARKDVEPTYGGERQLDASAFAAARMSEAARWLGDKERLDQAGELIDALQEFRTGTDDVVHTLRASGAPTRSFRDYLAYSDAMLADYLAFGRIVSLVDGYRVLQRGLATFSAGKPGAFVEGVTEGPGPYAADVPSPAITDDLGESSLAMAVRLLVRYGQLMGVLKQPESTRPGDFRPRETARQIVSVGAAAANRMQNQVSAFFASAAELNRDRFVLVVGPGSVERASQIARKNPTLLAAPVVGRLQPPFDALEPGAYSVFGGKVVERIQP